MRFPCLHKETRVFGRLRMRVWSRPSTRLDATERAFGRGRPTDALKRIY